MEITMNRLMYLMYLFRAEGRECTVTKLANLFQVSKSTVSRNMDYFVEQGLVFANSMKLTAYGYRLAQKYAEELKLLEVWVRWTAKCDEKEVRENAMAMAVNMTENVKQQLLQKIRTNQLFQRLDYASDIAFSELVQEMEDGEYPVSFVIYREQHEAGRYVSMANRGFRHPARLRILGDRGMLQLQAVTMERRNMLDNVVSSGKLLKLDYVKKGEFVPADKDGDIYEIPADALDYTYHKEEKLLVGNLAIQMYAPLANKKLHTRSAVLSLIIHAG